MKAKTKKEAAGESTRQETLSTQKDTTKSLKNQEKAAKSSSSSGQIEKPDIVQKQGESPVLKPLSSDEINKGSDLKSEKKKQDAYTPLIPVSDDAPAFDKHTADYHNQKFKCYPKCSYAYHTEDGGLVGYMVRWEILQEDGVIKKEILPYIYAEHKLGGRKWISKGFPVPRPLYHLPQIVELSEAPILVCEGEKAAEAGTILFPEYISTTSPHGAKSLNQADWSVFKGRNIILCPDFDEAGQQWAEELTNICKKVGVKSTRYLFPEMFNLLRIPYFEKRLRYQEGLSPRMNVEDLFGHQEQEDNQGIEEISPSDLFSNEKEEAAKFKSNLEKPLNVKTLSEHGSEDAAYVMEEAGLLDFEDLMDFAFYCEKIAPQGYDLADALTEGWTADLMQAVINEAGGEDKIFSAVLCSQIKGFKTTGGMFTLKPSGVFCDETKVCGFIKPVASCRNIDGEQWTLLAEFIDKDFKQREIFIPLTTIVKDGSATSEMLINAGLWVNIDPKTGRQNLKYYLNQTPKERMMLVNKIGWHGQNYVLPHKTWGKPEKEKHKLYLHGSMPLYEEMGTLEQWTQEIGRYLKGNSRLIFSVCMNLTSSFLTPLGRQNFGVHYIGNSSIGKSTILYVVASIFGAEVKSWRTTDNCAEAWAREANDNIFFLDELGKAPNASVVSEMLYMLGDGQGKGRLDRLGAPREVTKFKTFVLSSGEMSIEDKMREGFGKRTFYAGQSVRLAQIQADAGKKMGIYENLHGFKNGARLSDHLVKASLKYRGTLGDAWISYCCSHYHEVLEKAERYAQFWMDKYHLEDGTDGQVLRVKGHYAYIAALGEIAIEQKLLRLEEGDAQEATAILFNDWLNQRGGIESHEDMEVVKKLVSFIEEHGSSRFENPWNTGEDGQTGMERPNNEKINNRAGFRKFVDDQYIYYFLPVVFTRDILDGAKGTTQKARLKKLADAGYIQTSIEKKEGKDMMRYSKTERIPSHGVKKVYVVELPAD
jgi:uncharacterized protein (DUF927 family)